MTFQESKRETLEEKYLGKLPRKALAFMKACLKMDPSERITAAEALYHPYFEGLVPVPSPTMLMSHREADVENSIVGSSGIRGPGSLAPSLHTTIIHNNNQHKEPQSSSMSTAFSQIPMNSLQKSTIVAESMSIERKSVIGRIADLHNNHNK